MHGLTVGPGPHLRPHSFRLVQRPKAIEARSSDQLTHLANLGSKMPSWHAVALCVHCSVVVSLAVSCTPPAAMAGLISPTLLSQRPLKHRSITGIYIRRTHLYNCTRKHLAMNIFVCLEIPPSMQASMRSACKEPARKVRIVIADVPEEKEKQNLHLRHKRHNHQHHLPWGTVATDMHRSPGLDRPTSFVPTGDPTRWPSPGQNPNFGDKGFVGDASNRSESVSRYITQSRSQC